MHLYLHVLSSCLVLIWLSPSNAICPTQCSCKQNERGKRKVSCVKGGMVDPIPTSNMDQGMEVLEISAPDNKWNVLTISAIFQRFRSLEELHIVRSTVFHIGMHAFWGVPSLRVLNLTFNNISAVSDHNFRGLVSLIELNLDNNMISDIPSGVFRHLSELRILTLQRNNIKELVPRVFLKLGKLQVLKLSGNSLEELSPEIFKDILELRVLECRSCGLRRINTQIYHLLPYLTHLDLGNNRMQFIMSDEFNDLHKLRFLWLDGNQLPVVLERTFVNQRQLRGLSLARNRLAKITNTAFLNLTALEELDIGYNKLDKLEGVVLHPVADSLSKLVVSGNQFPAPVLRVALQVAYRVTNLQMADMGIGDIPAGLLPERIKQLNVSGNNLTNLVVHALPQQLHELDISRNKFRGLEERVVLKLVQLRTLKLHHNPWCCDLCHIVSMLLHVNRSKLFQNTVCASPNSLNGRMLISLNVDDLSVCVDDSENGASALTNSDLIILILCCSCLLLLIVCATLVVFSCFKRRADNARRVVKRGTVESEVVLQKTTAIFENRSEISLKFALDLTEQKVSVSTIDEIKRDTPLHVLPNGTGFDVCAAAMGSL